MNHCIAICEEVIFFLTVYQSYPPLSIFKVIDQPDEIAEWMSQLESMDDEHFMLDAQLDSRDVFLAPNRYQEYMFKTKLREFNLDSAHSTHQSSEHTADVPEILTKETSKTRAKTKVTKRASKQKRVPKFVRKIFSAALRLARVTITCGNLLYHTTQPKRSNSMLTASILLSASLGISMYLWKKR